MRPSQVGGLMAVLLRGGHGATLKSKVAALPSNVQVLGPIADSEILTLAIGLKLQSKDKLESKLRDVSDPASPHYGQYLDARGVRDMFGPSDASRTAVKAWLKAAGVHDVVDHDFQINFAVNTSTANSMLSTHFQSFMVDGVPKIRTLEYSLPDDLLQHIDVISPTTFFGKTRAQAPVPALEPPYKHNREVLEDQERAMRVTKCDEVIEPQCLEEMYNFGKYNASKSSKSHVAFASFLNESARYEDLNLYQKAYKLPLNNFSTVTINGGVASQDIRGSYGEANLDAQFMAAVIKTLPFTQYITGGSPPFVPSLGIPDAGHNTNEPYLEFYNYLLNQTNAQLPQVISISYGDDEQTVPRDYAARVCNLIGLMGIRGISILESSGDTGVGAACLSNDGHKKPEFTPQFPSTCPYLTSVGGTQSYAPEVAWDASSGGFSNYFESAWYQTQAVNDYLEKGITAETKKYFSHYTNFSGRAFPDIAAHSLSPYYLYYSARHVGYTGGTSAATPVVAGIIGLLNDARFKAGKPAMGFLNPWLYSTGYKALTDVTSGSALGCNGVNAQTGAKVEGGGVIPFASWNGTKGWDPATGLGMPDFEALRKLALA